jgi:hypothetical protein
MNESQNEDVVRPANAVVRFAMLVTCSRCGRLHPPITPLAFHPVCASCASGRLPR